MPGLGGGPGGGIGGPTAGGAAGPGTGAGLGSAVSSTTLAYLQQHRGDAKYLVAVFGAQTAAGIILQTDGASVLPIGGFSGSDPVPTLAQFTALVASGDVKDVLVSEAGGGMNGAAAGSTATQIQAWVTAHCTQVTDAGTSGLYECTAGAGSRT